MTWGISSIKAAYDKGDTGENSHMIVAHDTIDFENYAIYVPKGANPRAFIRGAVDECYAYRLGWEAQSKESRARNWD